MMTKNFSHERDQIKMMTIDQLATEDHLIRKRHIWVAYVEEAEHLLQTYEIKEIYLKRKETIERVFADAKEKHGIVGQP
jgi:hypothetical protein